VVLWGRFALVVLLSSPLSAQNFSGGFNYYFPPADTASSRFIPRFSRPPLTDQDFVTIDQNGHFSVRGSPIRFFGANLVADGAFPTASKAWFIAGRMRKMGFNLVRFHHMDNPWSAGSLFEQGWTTRQLNPLTLDRLENILAELKKNGIFADVNLHVGRTFTSMDGLPDTDSLQDYGKGINYFDPWVLELHKEYARELLTHVSPYTGKSLANDPVMAMIEVTNENSLYRYWHDNKLKHLSRGGILTARHVRMLDSLWVAFLRQNYGSTLNLSSAWNVGSYSSDGVNRVVNGDFETLPPTYGWQMETHGTAAATFGRDSLQRHSGSYSTRVDVNTVDGTDWHLQWKQIGLSVIQDTAYTISFAARSDSARTIWVSLMRDISPWNSYGSASFQLTPTWQIYSFTARATETAPGFVRLAFTVGGHTGIYWFDDISMVVPGVGGLDADESLESSFVRRIDYGQCPAFTDARVRDMSAFYLNLQDNYFAHMRSFLRDTLGVRVPIVGTNWNVGPADMAVQSKLDYIDNHSYWDHPSFPGIPWSSTDWNISNTPMVQGSGGGTISGLMAAVPVLGKPFTVSEYNHPFPNRYQSEGVLFLSAYSALHSADALMFFDYNGSDDWETDKITSYFSIHRNSAMMALVPSCAAAFQQGLISPAQRTLVVDYSPDDYLALPRRDNSGWAGPSLIDRTLALKYAVRAGSFSSATRFDPATMPPAPTNPYISDTKEISWNTAGLLSVAAPRFVGASGLLNNFAGTAVGPFTLSAANGFGTMTWVSLTSDSLTRTRLSLITLSTMTQNSGMIWDGTTTIHNNWGGSPTQVAPVLVVAQLTMQADSIRVYPLDPSGKETKGFASYVPSAPNRFTILLHQAQMTSMWFGVEAFGNGTPTNAEEMPGDIPLTTRLEQNYPNPFNPTTVVSFQLSAVSDVRLVVYDLLGREVETLVNEKKQPGSYTAAFDGTRLASGVYLVRLKAGDHIEIRKMVLTK
jgi:hypothetical protein